MPVERHRLRPSRWAPMRAIARADRFSRLASFDVGRERGPQPRLATNPSNDIRRDEDGGVPPSSRRPTH